MGNRVFYIDPGEGSDANDGLSASRPFKKYEERIFQPGDTVLFKRNSAIRGWLDASSGETGNIITYGAYGEGDNPSFIGSQSAADKNKWLEYAPSIWRFEGVLESEICNIIYDGNECGQLRWSIDALKKQGDWHFTHIGRSSENDGSGRTADTSEGILYVCSSRNPGDFYKEIECALWGNRKLSGGKEHIAFENIDFKYSGVHGYQQTHAKDITIRNCGFSFIGGAVWSRSRKIRFGNAVELWDGAWDVTVENCVFSNIYDSGVTHQGGDMSKTPDNVRFINNVFIGCGMSAYECRGPSAKNVFFEHNICVDTGLGFSAQTETMPRQSEIYPEPMGHHVFIWRMDDSENTENISIRGNIFFNAPNGAAIYSIISEEDERKFNIDKNFYYHTNHELLMKMNGKAYGSDEFGRYTKETGHDASSVLVDCDKLNMKGRSYPLNHDIYVAERSKDSGE